MRSVLIRRFVTLALASSLLFSAVPAAPAQAATIDQLRSALEDKINDARAYRGLRRLRISTYTCPAALLNRNCMEYFAQDHTKRMAVARDMYHDTPDRLWAEVPSIAWWRAENVGIVSAGSGAAARVHRAFMDSDGHRANILNPRATHMGIGVYKSPYRCPGFQSGTGCVYFTERFTDVYPLP
jgi:uncharacterized protein YkwD